MSKRKRVRIGIYGRAPIALLTDRTITPNEIRVYAALTSFQGDKDSCYPGLVAIAERAFPKPGSGNWKAKINAASLAIQGLEKKGWIEKERRFLKSNIYYPLHDALVSRTTRDTIHPGEHSPDSFGKETPDSFGKRKENLKQNIKEKTEEITHRSFFD